VPLFFTSHTFYLKMAAKDKQSKRAERKKLEKRLRAEAMIDFKPIALGSLAMIASSLSNQGT